MLATLHVEGLMRHSQLKYYYTTEACNNFSNGLLISKLHIFVKENNFGSVFTGDCTRLAVGPNTRDSQGY